jgi:ribosomal protein S18 acetylase RimI-like enzyme
MLIDPDFQSIGLGKQLLCDAISHLIEISKDSAESIDINVAVVSPILRRYLRTLGFKWVQPYSHLANTVEMKLALSDTDAIMAMCEDLTSISNI